MLATNMVKAALPGRYMASHDLKGAQWAKPKRNTWEVLGFAAKHGLWATSWTLQYREDSVSTVVAEYIILSKDGVCATFDLDKLRFRGNNERERGAASPIVHRDNYRVHGTGKPPSPS